MSADLKTAASAVPKTLVSQSLAATDTVLYTAVTGTSVKLSKIRVTNADGSARNVTLTIVKSGGTSGATNKIMSAESVAAGARVDLGSGDWLGEGDAIWGFAPSSTNVDVVISGIEFGGGTGSAVTGIQTDAIGTGGHGTGTVTGTNAIGTAANRYLFGALMVQPSTFVASYDTLTMSCTDGAMTALGHADFNYGSGAIGEVYLFGRANPTSGSTQTLTGTAAKSGVTMVTVLGSMSKSGVASVASAVTDAPTTVSALSLAITSAVGHVPMFAGVFRDAPQDLFTVLRARYFNGALNAGITVPQWLVLADAIGAATVTATTSNTSYHAAVGVDVVPA